MGSKREDQTLTCVQCGAQFVFSADEQEFFESRNLHSPPKRCKPCRAERRKARRGRRGGGRRMKEYRGPAFRGERSGQGVYRSPAFQDAQSGEGIYTAPAFREAEGRGEDVYTAPAFREAEGQGEDVYSAPAFREPEHPELGDGILSGRGGGLPSDEEEEHDLESGPPPSYREPRTAEELYTSPAFADTDPASYAPSYRRREMHDIVCGECGRKAQVPFKPKKDRPVYCKECFGRRRR